MRGRMGCLLLAFLSGVLFSTDLSPQEERSAAVSPARVEVMQNLGATVTNSYRPTYLPREWGRLVAVERLDSTKLVLVLEGAKGEIHLVRLSQRGGYLYLDTTDRGGIVILIPREP